MDTDNSIPSVSAKRSSAKQMMMAVILIVLILLLGGGVYLLLGNKASQTPVQQTATATPTPENKNIFTSIQDAVSKSLSLQCDYTGDDGIKTIAYIKGGAVRADVTGKTAEQSGSVIVKDSKMYYWNGKVGMTAEFDMSQMQQMMPSTTPTGKPTGAASGQGGSSVMQNLEKYKQYCKPAVVSDSLFVPPTDVKFTDYTKMMQNSVKVVPSGTTGMSEEQIKIMMQQYATPSPTGN